MKHRYGRHGDKAWLRWRKKHFRRTSLTLAPQLAVLHVPLEFLSRIRKVTILMADGTELAVEVTTTDALPSPTVDADTEKLGVVMLEQIPSPLDDFFAEAKRVAKDEVEKAFKGKVDPYNTKPNVEEATSVARIVYYRGDSKQLTQKWSKFSDALEHFLQVFKAEYWSYLDQFRIDDEPPTPETRKLLVFARKDKYEDDGAPSPYVDNRALIRAYISLSSNGTLCQEDVNEDTLARLPERVRLYQKLYDEFKPAKEED